MLVKTKHFGEVEIDDSKLITFEKGIMGLEDLKKYVLIFDEKEGEEAVVYWLQSLEEPAVALPVISPTLIKPDYNPLIEEEVLESLGQVKEDGQGLLVLLSLTIPTNIEDISVNLKAPFVINVDTQKACQVIAGNDDYEIKYKICDILNKEAR